MGWLGPAIALVLLLLAAVLATAYMARMPGQSYHGRLEPLTEKELASGVELRSHIERLAGTIGERNLYHYPALTASADYISQKFREMGYALREQTFQVQGLSVRNLEAELLGQSRPEEIVLLGAHYDSVLGSPGANDNASGVASLLVLAQLAREEQFARTLRFVAFVNEEPPYFQTRSMGSRVYAAEAAERRERIVAMLSLETIGYYSDREGSQSYPFPFSWAYPSTGNFIGFVGNLASRDLVQRVVANFRSRTRFPSEGVAAWGLVPGVGWSDQWSFWKEGYPGVMVTDTALFRYPHYHTPQDTPEKIDYERLARVVSGLLQVVSELAGREPPESAEGVPTNVEGLHGSPAP